MNKNEFKSGFPIAKESTVYLFGSNFRKSLNPKCSVQLFFSKNDPVEKLMADTLGTVDLWVNDKDRLLIIGTVPFKKFRYIGHLMGLKRVEGKDFVFRS